jgi:hypothetical protein
MHRKGTIRLAAGKTSLRRRAFVRITFRAPQVAQTGTIELRRMAMKIAAIHGRTASEAYTSRNRSGSIGGFNDTVLRV